MRVTSRDDGSPAERSWQYQLLDRPHPEIAGFYVWAFTYAAMIRGNAYLWKVKAGNQVSSLYPVDPRLVTPKYKDGVATFEISEKPGRKPYLTVGRETIIHLPGVLLENPYIGVSIVEAQRNGLGTYLAQQEFQARFLANDGAPGVVLKHTSNMTEEQRNAIRDSYEARHGGVGNAGRPAVLWGGWEIDRLPISLADAQFIDAQRFSVQEIARMLGVPSGMLGDPEAPGQDSVESENMRFLQYGLKPWMDRLEESLEADPDLFPNESLELKIDSSELLRADIKSRYDAYRLARQGGWVTPNEIRAREGLQPVDGGDEIQITPVGGAPNAAAA
jgi:HK97 family phage portal protein